LFDQIMENQLMRCPVCLGIIDRVDPAFGDYSTFNCTACGNYEITGSALTALIRRSKPERFAALERAKKETFSDDLPRITTEQLSAG
jgi:hypothetical protein